MPADGIALPIKADFGTSRWQLLQRCYMSCPRGKKASSDVLFAMIWVTFRLVARLSGDPQEAAWAARRAYNAVDHFVMRGINRTIVDRDIEKTSRRIRWYKQNFGDNRQISKICCLSALKRKYRWR
jgi:hypothetical protein